MANRQYPTIFHLLSSIFSEAKARCVLIGGFAVNYYKVSRQTADVDFLVTKDDFKKISGALEQEGFKKDYEIVELIRINKVNAKDPDIKKLCLKYGSSELYNKILEMV